ncbi:DUF3558 family protein [Corynebacterium sp. HMSC074H12]|uniref:DUF3558 family protein n=1 Tax=Corynebacterium sp. HMSC074H12 TaxID=1739436 RepID=UPI000A0019F3
MKRIGGLALVAVCIGVLSNCAAPLGLSARDNGNNSGGFSNFSGDMSGGGSVDSGVAEATATKVRESQASSSESRAGGGVLPPLGEFDRTEPGFQVFDPCTAEAQSAFRNLGLLFTGEINRETGFRSCRFEALERDGSKASVSIESRDYSVTEIRSAFPNGTEAELGGGEAIYLVEESLIANATCTGYVETVEGSISLSWTNLSSANSIKGNCKNVERVIRAVI